MDLTHAEDTASVTATLAGHEALRWTVHAHVDKYDQEQTEWAARRLDRAPEGDDFTRLGVQPYATADAAGNLLTTAGLNRLTSLLIAAGGQALTNTATRIGVGNSSTAATVAQTDLQAVAGAANRWFMTMDATYPTQANGVLTAKASFATGDGNFVWAEWCIDVAAPTVAASAVVSALMFNRKVEALGTKASGTWVHTATVTITPEPMAIFTLPELASYLQQDLDTATATLIQTLTDGLIAERIGTVAIPAPSGVKAVALEIAARAYRNPARLSMETIDDYTWRVDNGEAGVFLLEDEVRRMRPTSARVRSQKLSVYGDITV